MNRNLDPIYQTIIRNGRPECVCLSDMTREELTHAILIKDKAWLVGAVSILARCLRELGDKYDARKEY